MKYPAFSATFRLRLLAGAACAFVVPTALAQNHSPVAPVITEPIVGRIINPADLHMETGPFSDQDVGDTHLCTDWEVWTLSPQERVWVTACISGLERVHTHLGDGIFQGSHAGRRTLVPSTNYELRVRHRDSSGVAATEWSPWSTRAFVTGNAATVFALELGDVLNVPAPTLKDRTNASVTLPLNASVRVTGFNDGTLIEFRGRASGSNQINNPAALASHGVVRVTISASSAEALSLTSCDLTLTTDEGTPLTLYLPAVTLAAGTSASYWVASNGATYVATAGQTTPDFSSLARGASVPWTTASDFRADVVATGMQMPSSIAFVPNPGTAPNSPLFYVAELYGSIKVVRRDGVVGDYATGLLNFNPSGNFPGSGEQGLACITVDRTNGDLYATMVYSSVPGQENAAHYPAVDRFTSTNGGLTMSGRTRILTLAPETQGQSHQISNISFGPDANLYVHVGDGFDAAAAQNISYGRGKILRMNRQGQPIATNPYYNATNGITPTDYIYARGVRNPFGGAWRFSDGQHFIVENGPSVDRFSMLRFGYNYGYDGSDQSMTIGALYNWSPATAPVNIAFVQNEVFAGSGFPASYFGRAYVTQSGATFGAGPGDARNKCITEWIIDTNGTLVSGPRTVANYNGGGYSTAVAIASGPDGLYYSDFYSENSGGNPTARGANILRLKYVAPPPPPDCNGNGIPDATDIANGTSRDCNGNGIPDECDISSGRSTDCDGNGIPDECDSVVVTTTNFDTGNPFPFTVNGAAIVVNGVVRLTPATGNQNGTLIRGPLSTMPMTQLDASFDFKIGNGSGADGMSFAAFDSSIYNIHTLFSEEGPGSTDHHPSGPGALVVQLDTYDNNLNGVSEGNNTVEVVYAGTTLGRFTPSFSLRDNQWHRASVVFRDRRVWVRFTTNGVTETTVEGLEVPNYVPFVALLGFAGRTGGLNDEHWVDNVSFAVPGPNDANGNGIPDSCECVADFNRDGGVDGSDVEAFFNQWELGAPSADVNFDGGVDGSDIEVFFLQWTNGGC
jgi:glucose/arabinose dehydrogenase